MTKATQSGAGFALMALVSSLCISTPALAEDAPPVMEKCDKTLGVVRIQEDTGAEWYRYYVGRLGSTAPVISAMVMESNCFVVVERGTGERDINAETARARGDEARESSTRGKGQQVVADYLLKPEIVMNKKGDSGGNFGGVGKLLPGGLGNVIGAGRVGFSSNEAATWVASSRVGSRISERGMRARVRPAASMSIIGKTKLAVLPVPVCAQPRTSLPRFTWGIACSWIGVGLI